MAKKDNKKQQYIMMILTIIASVMAVKVLHTDKLNKKIKSFQRRSTEQAQAFSFTSGRIPKEEISVNELKKKLKDLKTENKELKEKIEGSPESVLPVHEKVRLITQNADKLKIKILQSETVQEGKTTVYSLQFSCSFPQLTEFIEKSYKKPGRINVRNLQFDFKRGRLATLLEFNL